MCPPTIIRHRVLYVYCSKATKCTIDEHKCSIQYHFITPPLVSCSIPISDQDDEHGKEAVGSGDDALGPRTTSTLQAGTQPPLDTSEYGTVDLTRDCQEATGGARHRIADADSSSDGGKSTLSLGSWLQPVPPPKAVAAAKSSNRRRKRPVRETERAWATTSSQRQDGATAGVGRAGGDGSLAAWLEPRQQSAASRERRSTPGRSEAFGAVVGHGSSGQSDSDDNDDSGRWMSDRLEGLDPNGAARYRVQAACAKRRPSSRLSHAHTTNHHNNPVPFVLSVVHVRVVLFRPPTPSKPRPT